MSDKKIGCVGHDCDECSDLRNEIELLREENTRLLAANKDCMAHFEDARHECESLRAYEKDGERLEWMATTLRRESSIRFEDGTFVPCLAWPTETHGDGLRAAIDAAMKKNG